MVLSSLSQNHEPSELSVHLYFVSGSDTYLLATQQQQKEVRKQWRRRREKAVPWIGAFFPKNEVDDTFNSDVIPFLRLTQTLLFDARNRLSAL
jgi:hypothetical protein